MGSGAGQVGQAGQGMKALDQRARLAHGQRGRRLAGRVKPGDARAMAAQGVQCLGQLLRRVGVKAVGEQPHPCLPAELRTRMAAGKFHQVVGDARARAEAGGDRVDLFLHGGAVAAHQRRDLGQVDMEHKHPRIGRLRHGSGHAQKESRV